MTASSTTISRRRGSRRPLLLAGGAAIALLLAWLAFGYFGIQAAFIDNEVSEAGPTFDSGVVAGSAPDETATAAATASVPSTAVADETVEPEPVTADETAPAAGVSPSTKNVSVVAVTTQSALKSANVDRAVS